MFQIKPVWINYCDFQLFMYPIGFLIASIIFLYHFSDIVETIFNTFRNTSIKMISWRFIYINSRQANLNNSRQGAHWITVFNKGDPLSKVPAIMQSCHQPAPAFAKLDRTFDVNVPEAFPLITTLCLRVPMTLDVAWNIHRNCDYERGIDGFRRNWMWSLLLGRNKWIISSELAWWNN